MIVEEYIIMNAQAGNTPEINNYQIIPKND